jgi:hypothetical protein
MVKATARQRRFWSTDFSLSALLLLLVLLIFVFYPLGEIGVLSGVILEVFFSLILISGVMSITRRRSATVVMCVIALAAMFSGWWGLIYPGPAVFVLKSFFAILFIGSLVSIVLIEVFRAGRITVRRIQGAIAAYLLLAVLWAMFYRLVDLLKPEAFHRGPGAIPGPLSSILTREFIYFSLASITTVGYSGLVAVHPLALSLVMLEALVGQLFPAILLARLVSMEVSSRT